MRIGYSVEGSTDRAFILALHRRWCPDAEMIEGHFRGKGDPSRTREIAKTCKEWMLKGVDVMVFLTDGNGRNWREVMREEIERIPSDRQALAIVGVPDRNIECWICAFPLFLSERLHVSPERFSVDDPKGQFEGAMGISGFDRREGEIFELVIDAPLHRWLTSPSFKDFYAQVRDMSQRQGCAIENLADI